MRISIELAHSELLDTGLFNKGSAHQAVHLGLRLAEELQAVGLESHFALLVDDKQVPAHRQDVAVAGLVDYVSELLEVDYYCAEHRLVDRLNVFLRVLDNRSISDDLLTRLDVNGSLPCAADISLWHLLRLGVLSDPNGIIVAHAGVFTPSDLVVSVLPETLREAEETAQRLYLKRVPGVSARIHRLFYPASPDRRLNEKAVLELVSTIAQEATVR